MSSRESICLAVRISRDATPTMKKSQKNHRQVRRPTRFLVGNTYIRDGTIAIADRSGTPGNKESVTTEVPAGTREKKVEMRLLVGLA